MKAMILAAGFGTRLKPYSLLRPKPLFPVLDQPLLLFILDKLRQSGCDSTIINAHHLREQFALLLKNETNISLQLEEKILGTGGGLRLAMDKLGPEPVLITNGDIFHDIDLIGVYDGHLRSGARATLVLHDYPRFNNVAVSGERILGFSDIEAEGESRMAFTGIHVLDPALLTMIPKEKFFNIIDCYRYWIKKGAFVRAQVVKNNWTDIGTPADYLALHGSLLAERERRGQGSFYVGSDVSMGPDVELSDWVSIGSRAVIGKGARLTRVVVWDGAEVAEQAVLRDTIVAC